MKYLNVILILTVNIFHVKNSNKIAILRLWGNYYV